MIRLIATDLDGTLLDSKKQLPEELPRLLEALTERGISFVPVSGRSHACLKDRFLPYRKYMGSEEFSCVCHNGNLSVFRGEIVNSITFTEEQIQALIRIIREIGGLSIALCGISTVFYDSQDPAVEKQMLQFFTKIAYADPIETALGKEGICKISCIDRAGVQEHSYPLLKYLETEGLPSGDRFYLADAGDNWMDIMPFGGDKGAGIRALAAAAGCGMDEIMIFGDFLNDLPMMGITPNSWCMKNGHEDVKAVSGHVTEWTNDENGVIRTLNEILDLNIL